MKTHTIQGVPYTINDKNEVFMYQPSSSVDKHVQIGTYDSKSQSVTLFDNWEEVATTYLEKYRETLKQKTESSMIKAREIQGVSTT